MHIVLSCGCWFTPSHFSKTSLGFCMGGGNNTTSYSYPYWFINALFVSLVMFTILRTFLKEHNLYLFLVAALCWILCHLSCLWNALPFPLPWSIEQSFGAVVYIYIGYLAKDCIRSKWNNLLLFIPLTCLMLLLLNIAFDYELNMKAMKYNNLVLDILVPCGFTFMLYKLSVYILNVPYINSILSCIGKRSITIFFLHAFLLNRFNYIGLDSIYVIVPAIIIISLTIHYIFDHTGFLSKVFIGR